jgi:hypothetical protein
MRKGQEAHAHETHSGSADEPVAAQCAAFSARPTTAVAAATTTTTTTTAAAATTGAARQRLASEDQRDRCGGDHAHSLTWDLE